MKRLPALAVCAAALFANACEKHPASRLPGEHDTQFGEHHGGHGHAADHHAKPATAHPAPATPAAVATPGTDAKPGEAPKFFPEKK